MCVPVISCHAIVWKLWGVGAHFTQAYEHFTAEIGFRYFILYPNAVWLVWMMECVYAEVVELCHILYHSYGM